MKNLFDCCLFAIQEPDPWLKIKMVRQIYQNFTFGDLIIEPLEAILSIPIPGRPAKPELVSPLEVRQRSVANPIGHASLIHALAHIEFNAINLALDACYRFQNMPVEFYSNWLDVAHDEAYHFELLANYLATLGYQYGDFTAHNGLWEMAYKTEHSLIARMGMVPRVLEARGIDAVPTMQNKLRQIADQQGVSILAIIHQDEIKHVQYGDKWFRYLCAEQGLEVNETFITLMHEYSAPPIRGNFNRQDRILAGFTEMELDSLANYKPR
jgi:uncharacterized ferritin-like protein (DUF455 family)